MLRIGTFVPTTAAAGSAAYPLAHSIPPPSVSLATNALAPVQGLVADGLSIPRTRSDMLIGGLCASFFFLCGAPLSLIAGLACDGNSRVRLSLYAGCISTLALIAHAAAHHLAVLLVARALLGACVGSLVPISASLIGDLVHSAERPRYASFAGLSAGLGGAVGMLAMGGVGHLAGGWRAAFLAYGVAVLCSSCLVWQVAVEPPREGLRCDPPSGRDTEGASRADGAMLKALRQAAADLRAVMRVPTNCIVYAQSLAGTLPWSVVAVFLPVE